MDRDEIVRLDRQHVWRPYTSTEDHLELDPIVVARAEGAWLHDADGRRYLDGNGSWWCNNLGHGHPRLRAALARQAESLMHCSLAGITHESAAALAEELSAIAPPGLTRAFFSDDGSTAVEVAIKIAFQYWQQNGRPSRRRFVSLGGAFHGDTVGAMSVGGIAEFRGAFGPLLFDAVRPADPADDAGWERAIATIEDTLARSPDEIAAVVVEPIVQGASGMRMFAPALLARLREATARVDTFLVADEVFTGLGRTGPMWACDHARVAPDLLCTAKALSGGVLPFAATLATERVFEGFAGGVDRALMHGHTFAGNPLGAAIAREVLAIYRDEDVLGQIARKAPRVAAAFDAIAGIPGVVRTRALGMIGAADLGPAGYRERAGARVRDAARRRGAYVRPLGNTVYVTPCFTIADADLDALLSIVAESIAEALGAQ